MNYFKTLVCIFILLQCDFTALAQGYYPLTKSGLFFDLAEASNGTLCLNDRAERYFFKHDTTIQGRVYKKLYYFSFLSLNGPDFCPPYVIDTNLFVSNIFIREDTSSKRVFLYNRSSQDEDLLYDFSLNKGDTLKSELHKQQNYRIVDTSYLITLKDSTRRKLIQLDNGRFYVEGIGGDEGFLRPLINLVGSWGKIFCVKNRLVPIYGNECNYQYVNNEVVGAPSISIFPNPAKEQLFIKTDIPFDNYSLIDSRGKELISAKYQKNLNLNLEAFQAGIYILTLKETNGSVRVQKIIKR